GGGGIAPDLVEGPRVGEPERPGARPAEVREVRASSERGPQVGGERSDVRAGAALHAEGRGRVLTRLERLDLDPVDADAARLAVDLLALARELVQAATTDLDRGHHGRHLLDLADEGARGPLDLIA